MNEKKENQPRKGWADQFKKMHEAGEDKLLIPDVFEDEEFLTDPENNWTWDDNSDQSKIHK
ncbi:hypothetical protein [Algoriphagus litoralis]|uniref:hypothetical protein n=1 Tax=Algoriphagus litoralis TaxID=2202829 RepID=UPI000DB9611D|nr:hypothetical protein [Algoriphagus litoralis]